jgi:glycerophosphoryl diester phosphodiesterase
MDRKAFVKPVAHRGLHNAKAGIIENTAPAFEAGLKMGYGVECDLQPARDGTPMVFHDFTLDRLIDAKGPIAERTPAALMKLRYKGARDIGILSYADFLDLCAGRGPLLVEVKSDWTKPSPRFLKQIAKLSAAYKGPLGLMSFDPVVMATLAELAPTVPRGIVSGVYEGEGWWLDVLGKERGWRLTHLLESGPAKPSFYSYHVKSLPAPVTQYVREVQGLPVFCWTVRSKEDRKVAAQWSDAPTFEGLEY